LTLKSYGQNDKNSQLIRDTRIFTFIWLAYGLPLLAWMFLFGDNEHWFYNYAWIFAASIAIEVSAIAAIRIFRIGASGRYLRIHLWIPICLILSFASLYEHESIYRIEGITVESAAQNVFTRLSHNIDAPVRYVEYSGELPYNLDSTRLKSYWILGPNEPRGRFSISRHK